MDQYGNFAYIYDQLMDDVDYEAWVEHIEKLIAISGANVKNILELACGTGNITLPLARKEYDIAGLDISEEMLDVAREKSELENTPIVLLQQDMTQLDFDLYDLDCILCACDGINYITDLEDVKNLFGKVYELLKKEGIFIFDISSYYKLSSILGNNFMGEARDDISYMWTNYYDDMTQLLNMDLDFFVKVQAEDDDEDNLYERYKEVHLQRAHKEEELAAILEEAGFKDIRMFGDFSLEDVDKKSERVFFLAKK